MWAATACKRSLWRVYNSILFEKLQASLCLVHIEWCGLWWAFRLEHNAIRYKRKEQMFVLQRLFNIEQCLTGTAWLREHDTSDPQICSNVSCILFARIKYDIYSHNFSIQLNTMWYTSRVERVDILSENSSRDDRHGTIIHMSSIWTHLKCGALFSPGVHTIDNGKSVSSGCSLLDTSGDIVFHTHCKTLFISRDRGRYLAAFSCQKRSSS